MSRMMLYKHKDFITMQSYGKVECVFLFSLVLCVVRNKKVGNLSYRFIISVFASKRNKSKTKLIDSISKF